ncbi:MAG: hypothetical protein IPF66_14735 [Holophagales bacterium]|nr:hypothetical protein [Holophagales bacterium]
MRTQIAAALTLALAAAAPAHATARGGFELSVLVDGAPRPEFHKGGTVYVEALKGREYALRVTNPFGVRVGVALAVDGLNTVDASHRDAVSATKWILEPYQSIVLEGWQVNLSDARRFVFTGERDSYGAALGRTENLGVIEAVFFREKVRRFVPVLPQGCDSKDSAGRPAAEAPAPRAKGEAEGSRQEKSAASSLADEYAATGMGERTRHDVTRVDLELERTPAARLKIRYEFRPQLVRLGILPAEDDRLARRERARGFDRFCPEPDR